MPPCVLGRLCRRPSTATPGFPGGPYTTGRPRRRLRIRLAPRSVLFIASPPRPPPVPPVGTPVGLPAGTSRPPRDTKKCRQLPALVKKFLMSPLLSVITANADKFVADGKVNGSEVEHVVVSLCCLCCCCLLCHAWEGSGGAAPGKPGGSTTRCRRAPTPSVRQCTPRTSRHPRECCRGRACGGNCGRTRRSRPSTPLRPSCP